MRSIRQAFGLSLIKIKRAHLLDAIACRLRLSAGAPNDPKSRTGLRTKPASSHARPLESPLRLLPRGGSGFRRRPFSRRAPDR